MFVRLLAALSALALLFPSAVATAQQTLPERELRRIVERERTLLEHAAAHPDTVDRRNLETQIQEIVRDYEGLLRREPDFFPAYVAYGLLLNRVGESRRSAEVFLRANALEPGHAIVHNQLGNYCAEEGRFEDALNYYLSAVDLAPREPLYHYQLGELLHRYHDEFVHTGRYQSATLRRQSTQAFRRAAELAPDRMPFRYRYAESLYDLEPPDWAGALAEWERLHTEARPGLERQTVLLHQAHVLLHLGRADEARALLERVTEPALAENRKTLIARLADSTPDAPP
jgi:tetratricopeptide (TPR) repeat protein